MLDSFTVEGFTKEEVQEKVKKRPDYHDIYPASIEKVVPKGILKFFKKPYWVGTYVIRQFTPAKKKALDVARTVLEEKNRKGIEIPSAAREVLRKPQYVTDMSDVKKAMAMLEKQTKNDMIPPLYSKGTEEELIRSPAVQIQVKIDHDEKCFADMLKARDLDDSFITEIMSAIRQTSPSPVWKDMEFMRSAVRNVISRFINVHKGVTAVDGERRYVMIVGPTGVGKTTTLVKVSTPFFQKRKTMRFITNDDYRIGAADQLKCYAEIMGVPIDVVNNPEQFNAKLTSAQEEMVFIDTAGRNPRDISKISELMPLLDCFGERRVNLEIFLVLSANTQVKDMHQVIRNFSGVNISGVIFTKVDEAETLGGMLSVLKKTRLPLAYTTHGQGVPEDVSHVDENHVIDLLFREQQ